MQHEIRGALRGCMELSCCLLDQIYNLCSFSYTGSVSITHPTSMSVSICPSSLLQNGFYLGFMRGYLMFTEPCPCLAAVVGKGSVVGGRPCGFGPSNGLGGGVCVVGAPNIIGGNCGLGGAILTSGFSSGSGRICNPVGGNFMPGGGSSSVRRCVTTTTVKSSGVKY